MTYDIVHRTTYDYTAPVTISHHVARLEPRGGGPQETGNFSMDILPAPTLRRARSDYFGNRLWFFSIQETHQRMEIMTTSRVTVRAQNPTATETSPAWEEVARLFQDPVSPDAVEFYQFVFDSPQACASFELADYAFESFRPGTTMLAGARDLTRRINQDFKYVPQATTVATPLEEVWENRVGVCQDFAHLAIACLRSIGLPARYVSGYLRTRPPEGGQRLTGVDASHAWFSIYSPGSGWLDFDPTNNVQPLEEHITVAYGRDFSDVSPVAGILTGGGRHTVSVAVDVKVV